VKGKGPMRTYFLEQRIVAVKPETAT